MRAGYWIAEVIRWDVLLLEGRKVCGPTGITQIKQQGSILPDVVVTDGQSGVVGGTSAVAPLWAALIADPDLTSEQIEDWEKQYDNAMKDAEDENSELVDPGDQGRPMRDTSQMSASDLNLLRVSSILGIVGTLIWVFGDLVGGLPK
jgi:hypothetical protein